MDEPATHVCHALEKSLSDFNIWNTFFSQDLRYFGHVRTKLKKFFPLSNLRGKIMWKKSNHVYVLWNQCKEIKPWLIVFVIGAKGCDPIILDVI